MPPELLRSRVRRFGIALICLKVALVPLIFDAASDQSFTVPKTLLSHALAYALVGVIAGLLIRFGPSFVVRSRLHYVVLAFLAVNVLATVFAPDVRLALFGNHGRMLGLGTVADWVVLYFACVLLIRTRGEVLTVLGAAIAPTPIVLAYEFTQGAGKDPISWSTGNTERPFSTFGLSTALGEYLVILAATLCVVAVFLEGLSRTRRVLLLVWSAVLVGGAIRSGTRSILIGAVFAFGLTALLVWMRGATRRQRIGVIAVTAVAAAAMAVVLAFTPLGQRVVGTVVAGGGDIQVDPSTSGRLDLYRIAWGMVVDRPLLGYGPDSFAAGVPAHRPAPADVLVRESLATSAHGWIPFWLTGSGLLGFTAFLAVLGLAAWILFRRRGDAFALAGGAMAAAFLGAGLTSVDDISVDWLLWLGLALIVIDVSAPVAAAAAAPLSRKARRRERAAGRDASPPGPLNAPAVGAALGLVAMLAVLPAWTASREAKTSLEHRLGAKSKDAIEVGAASVRDDGGRAAYWHTLAFAYISAQRFRDANDALERARSLSPYDVLYANDQVQVNIALAQSGDASAKARALGIAEQTVRMDPNNPQAQLLYASTLNTFGDPKSAEAPARRALELNPGSQNELLYVTAVQVLTATGHAEEAVTVARAGLPLLNSPTAVALRYELARTLAGLGRTSEALAELDKVLVINPNLQAAQQLRAQLRSGAP